MKTSHAIHLLLFVSGAVGLVYELVWMRWCTAAVAATAPAAAATLAAVFLGFALGSALLARFSHRVTRPLAAYGVLEIALGVAAALVGPTLSVVAHADLAGVAATPAGRLAARTALAALVLLVPATLMGATLPALVNALPPGRPGVTAGGLYAVNLAGAVVGALAVPFVLLASLGVNGSVAVAIACSLAIGAGALALDRAVGGTGEAAAGAEAKVAVSGAASGAVTVRGPALLAFVSGFAQMGLQVLWTRMYAQVHASSIYAFAIVVAVYLVGLAAGAAIARALLVRGVSARIGLALSWSAAGAWAVTTPRLFWWLTDGLRYVGASTGGSDPTRALLELAVPVILPATVLGGMGMPFVMDLAGGAGPAGRASALGRVLAANALGCALGPLLVTFVALPGPGLWLTVGALGVVLALAGVALELPRAPLRALVLGGVVAAAWSASAPGTVPRARLAAGDSERLLDVFEGPHAIVAVLENERERFLRVDNSYTLGGTGSAGDERQQAHLPLVLHAGADQEVVFLGMGTGVTAAAALMHPVKRAVAVEIASEIIQGAHRHFALANAALFADPRAQVVSDDARAYLRTAGARFDVIIGDLVVPWRPGEATLFTAEHFAVCRKALKPGGLFCQWLPLFQLSRDEFRTIAATFAAEFPRTLLFRGDFFQDQPALALIGLPEGTRLDRAAIDARVTALSPKMQASLTNPYMVDRAGPWLYLVGVLDPAQAASAPHHTDASPWLELSAPRTHARGATFTGRDLFTHLKEVAARPLTGTPLDGLEPERLAWRDAGFAFAESALLGAEGKEADAQARADEAMAAVPEGLRRALAP